jgi:hypothetical protein
VLAGQTHLEDALGRVANLRLAVESEKSRPRVEDAVAGRGEARKQLLGPLESEAPVDDRKAENVEQAPYLATAQA